MHKLTTHTLSNVKFRSQIAGIETLKFKYQFPDSYKSLAMSYVTRNEKRETKRETRTVRETKFPGFANIRNEEREKQKIN